jgi:hypothetical protein
VQSQGATPLYEANEPPQRQCQLTVKLSVNLYNALAEMAAAEERSIAGHVRWMVKQRAEEAGLLSVWDES